MQILNETFIVSIDMDLNNVHVYVHKGQELFESLVCEGYEVVEQGGTTWVTTYARMTFFKSGEKTEITYEKDKDRLIVRFHFSEHLFNQLTDMGLKVTKGDTSEWMRIIGELTVFSGEW